MKEIKEIQLDSWLRLCVVLILRLFIEPLRVALEPLGCYWEPKHVFGRYEDRFLVRWVFHHGMDLFWIELKLVERDVYRDGDCTELDDKELLYQLAFIWGI